MSKVGRPRMPVSQLSRWGHYKRMQRELPSKPGHVRHHVKPGTYDHRARTVLITRARHAAIHNALKKHGPNGQTRG